MLYFTKSSAECTGCGACVAVCPKKCIEMIENEEGFLYPSASDDCIHCGKCEAVCPVLHVTEQGLATKQEAYCAVTKDRKIWQSSASGGAFSEICRAFGDSQTVVCGAAWNGFEVEHICIENVEDIEPLRKSKYIFSNTNGAYTKIKEYLAEGKKVVFCGTPCQVDGLNRVLGKSYESLLTIDLICHGVGSPAVFKSCISAMEKQFASKISSYSFRAKRSVYETDHLTKIIDQSNKEKYLYNDQYMQLFLRQDCLRASCAKNCRYRKEARCADITIADFKGAAQIFPELLGSKRNYSTIVFNTQKGKHIIENLSSKMILKECSIEDIKKYNPLFYRHTDMELNRDAFFEDFKKDKHSAIDKWTKPAQIYRKTIKGKIYSVLPLFLRKIIIRKVRKI